MADTEILDSVREWCEAQAQYDQENFPGGFPRYITARRLYLAGRALYLATRIEAADGRYSVNIYFEKLTEKTKGLLNDAARRT